MPQDKSKKKLSIKDKDILQNMSQRKCGTADMTVDGIDSKVYYGPIEGIDWTLVIVTPKHDIQEARTGHGHHTIGYGTAGYCGCLDYLSTYQEC